MQRKLPGCLAAFLLSGMLLTVASPGLAQSGQPASAPNMPKVGDMAPDFTLKYSDGTGLKTINLSDYRGKKNVVLAFYVFAFTGG